MQQEKISPIGIFFFFLTVSPYLFMRLGDNAKYFFIVISIWLTVYSFFYYRKKIKENKGRTLKKIKHSIPDMNFWHIVMFLFILSPIIFILFSVCC